MLESYIGWDERIEPKLFHRDTELGQFSLVSLDHVRMSFSDLLERCLNFSNSVTLKILNLLERSSNDTKSLRINPGSSEQLVDLSIFGLKRLLDGLMLLLQNKVPDSCLLVDLVNQSMELVKELLLLFLEVLELLKPNFELPFDLFRGVVKVRD